MLSSEPGTIGSLSWYMIKKKTVTNKPKNNNKTTAKTTTKPEEQTNKQQQKSHTHTHTHTHGETIANMGAIYLLTL